MPGVFLSYARADGELRAAGLRERLAREASDIVIQQDRLFLEGGIGWRKQVTEAIDSVEFLILLMTPAAIASGNVQREWRYARQQGVCVYPVKGAPDPELQFPRMPRWMSKAHFFDLEKEWPTFLAHLRKGCDTSRVPFMAPDLPPHFVARPKEYDALKNLLLTPDRSQPVAIATALAGAGGFGKTTLAAALCHDEDIVENFDDGILWVTLGQTPDVPGKLLTAYAALTGERPGFAGPEDAAFQLAQKLAQRTCLLVIDDVWDAAHLRPFLQGGKSSARLFTTRDANIASVAIPVNVDEMRREEAVALLSQGVPGLDTGPARDLAQRLGEWPLALELAAAMMRERVRLSESAGHAAARLLAIIERKGVRALEDPTAERRHRTISDVLEVSLELLGDAGRRRLAELSIFPEDVAIPLAAAASVWELDEFDAEDLAQRLARLSLLRLDLERGVLRLHDVMRSWLASNLAAAREIHDRLLNAWPDWRDLPELPGEYAWRWLPWHLAQAERKPDLQRILWNPEWMQAKLRATEVNALIADYEYLKPSAEMDLIQGALRLSSHVLAADAEQFAGQMVGRLLPHHGSPAIQRFTGEVAAVAPACWLRPLHPALHPPGTALVRTLEGHSAWVSGVAVTPDGKRAVSASKDHTLKVWDLETGGVLRTLDSAWVVGVAVTPDGKRAVSASGDHTLKVWDLETGGALRTLEGHSADVIGVAVTPDGKRAVSASRDNTLKVWDLESGGALRTLEGHFASVWGVAVTPDGKGAVSASDDHTLKVWDLESGVALRTLEGHSDSVSGVAVTADGKWAVSASGDHTLKVWDLKSGGALRTLEGHSASVLGVGGDGRRETGGFRVTGPRAEGVGPGDRRRAAHAGRALCFCPWRGGEGGREAGGFRVWGQNAEGVGPGDRRRAAHAGGPLCFCHWRGGDAGREAGGIRFWGPHAEGVGPGERRRAVHSGNPRCFCPGRGGDGGREAGRFSVWGPYAEGVGPGNRQRAARAGRPLCLCLWRGGDGGREAGGFRVTGQHAEGLGPGDLAPAPNAGRSLFFCHWRGGDAGREGGGFRVFGPHAEGVGPGERRRAAHAERPLFLCHGRGGDAGREAGGVRVLGQNAEGVGPGDRRRAAHAGRPL